MDLIRIGVVVDVDPVNYFATVNMFDGSEARDIQWKSSAMDSNSGGGLVYIPTKNSLCVVEMIDGKETITGFIADDDRRYDVNGVEVGGDQLPGFRNGRPVTWYPGDVGLLSSGKTGSYIKMGADGVVSVYSSPLCSLHMFPTPKNRMEITTESFKWISGESSMSVDVNRKKNTSDLTIDISNPEKNNSSSIVISSDKEGASLKISVTDKASFEITKEGGLDASFTGPVSISSDDLVYINDNFVVKK